MDSVQAVLIALISGGLVSLVEFLIRRSDEKHDKNSEIVSSLNTIKERILGIESRLDIEKADEARRSILSFDDELRRLVEHSEESFNQVLADIKYYRNFCKSHNDYENDKATSAIKHIRETYDRVKAENKFI